MPRVLSTRLLTSSCPTEAGTSDMAVVAVVAVISRWLDPEGQAGSSSVCGIQSRDAPSFGWLNSCGPVCTVGMVSKL